MLTFEQYLNQLTKLPSGTLIGNKDAILAKYPNATGPFYHRTNSGDQIRRMGFDMRYEQSQGDGIYFFESDELDEDYGKDLIAAYFIYPVTDLSDSGLTPEQMEPGELGDNLRELGHKAWTDGYQLAALYPSVIAIVSS